MHQFSFFTFALILLSCNSNSNSPEDTPAKTVKITEALIQNYSVKLIDGEAVKDSLELQFGNEYDENGRELSSITYSLNGEVDWKEVYEYDDKGIKTGSKFYVKGDSLTTYYRYESDYLGRTTRYAGYDVQTDTFIYDVIYQYLEGGIKRSGYINKEGMFIYNYEYKYNDKGEEIAYIYINNRQQKSYPTTYRFTAYDEEGRWKERQQIAEDGRVKIIQTQTFREKDQEE